MIEDTTSGTAYMQEETAPPFEETQVLSNILISGTSP